MPASTSTAWSWSPPTRSLLAPRATARSSAATPPASQPRGIEGLSALCEGGRSYVPSCTAPPTTSTTRGIRRNPVAEPGDLGSSARSTCSPMSRGYSSARLTRRRSRAGDHPLTRRLVRAGRAAAVGLAHDDVIPQSQPSAPGAPRSSRTLRQPGSASSDPVAAPSLALRTVAPGNVQATRPTSARDQQSPLAELLQPLIDYDALYEPTLPEHARESPCLNMSPGRCRTASCSRPSRPPRTSPRPRAFSARRAGCRPASTAPTAS